MDTQKVGEKVKGLVGNMKCDLRKKNEVWRMKNVFGGMRDVAGSRD